MSVRVLVTRRWPAEVERALAERFEVVLNAGDRPMSQAELARAMGEFDVLCPTVSDKIDAAVITGGDRVKLIANYGVGFDHIDLAAAKQNRMAVTNTPGVLTDATADIALTLITAIRQGDLFAQATIADYLFDRDRIHAFLNLDDNELFIYQRLYELLAQDVPSPDVVIYLQSPTDVLKKRLKERARRDPERPMRIDDDYLRELNEAYNHFFFHYQTTPLLVVETSNVDVGWGDEVIDDLLKQVKDMTGGTRYYVPR